MHKNENGFGTIQDLGKNRRKRYAVRVTVGWIDGIQIRPYLGTFERRADAKKLLMQYGSGSPEERDRMLQAALSSKRSNKAADIVAAKQQRICTALPLNITLRDLYDRWKNTSSYKNLSVKTKGNYENAFSYLAPLHDEEFRDIKTSVLQDILDDLEVRHGSTLVPASYSSKHKLKVFCGLLYKYAMADDVVDRNYSATISLSKQKVDMSKKVFDKEERKKILAAATDPDMDIIITLLFTGFRINELLTLPKNRVDLSAGLITWGLKTEAGADRVVPIHPFIMPMIKKRMELPGDLMYYREPGAPLHYRYYTERIYYPALARLGVERKTPHTTRHTCATVLKDSGTDDLAIKLILGHAQYAFTADTYTHTDTDFLVREMGKMEYENK